MVDPRLLGFSRSAKELAPAMGALPGVTEVRTVRFDAKIRGPEGLGSDFTFNFRH